MSRDFYNTITGRAIKDKGPYHVLINGDSKQRRRFVSARAAMQAMRYNSQYAPNIYYRGRLICVLREDNKFHYIDAQTQKKHATNKAFYENYKG